jgi:hypothetical protein
MENLNKTQPGAVRVFAAEDLFTDKTVFDAYQTAIGAAYLACTTFENIGASGSFPEQIGVALTSVLGVAADVNNAADSSHLDALITLGGSLRTSERGVISSLDNAFTAIVRATDTFFTTYEGMKMKNWFDPFTTSNAMITGDTLVSASSWDANFVAMWKAYANEEVAQCISEFVYNGSAWAKTNKNTITIDSLLELRPIGVSVASSAGFTVTGATIVNAAGTSTVKTYTGSNVISYPDEVLAYSPALADRKSLGTTSGVSVSAITSPTSGANKPYTGDTIQVWVRTRTS